MYQPTPASHFQYLLTHATPAAIAWIQGNDSQPQLAGSVKFYRTSYGGVLVEAEIFGLPNIHVQGSGDFYGMHIHEYGNCTRPLIRPEITTILTACLIPSMQGIFLPFWAIRDMHTRYFMTSASL